MIKIIILKDKYNRVDLQDRDEDEDLSGLLDIEDDLAEVNEEYWKENDCFDTYRYIKRKN